MCEMLRNDDVGKSVGGGAKRTRTGCGRRLSADTMNDPKRCVRRFGREGGREQGGRKGGRPSGEEIENFPRLCICHHLSSIYTRGKSLLRVHKFG